MIFKNIFIENDCIDSDTTKNILSSLKTDKYKVIENLDDYWGRMKKPYLQKRDNLNLFIGNKKGLKVKEAPNAYGYGGQKHYYFVHAYNCIYECEYCYLQGYFNTPDIVLYVNHDEILNDIQKTINENEESIWFHSGEYSDSLALTHITGELPKYFKFFKKNPSAYLEIRTKSVNIKELLKLSPLKNVIISFSLSDQEAIRDYDLKTPSLKARLNAIEKLVAHGHQIGIHLDPIIYSDDLISKYTSLIQEIKEILPEEKLEYISIGVVRFTKPVYREVENNYPESKLLLSEFKPSFDGKIRYPRPMRQSILNTVESICIENGFSKNKIYQCMENETSEY